MQEYPAFVGGSFPTMSPAAGVARTVNFVPEVLEAPGAKSRIALYPSPGVVRFARMSGPRGRGLIYQDGRAFGVSGTYFEEISATGAVTTRGAVADDGEPATMAFNGQVGELFIASGNNGYLFTLATNTFTQVRTGGTRMVVFLDGYFFTLDLDAQRLYRSDLNDGATWDPLMFRVRATAGDPWLSLGVLGRDLWILGDETTEIYVNDGGPLAGGGTDFSFSPHPSGFLPFGIDAKFSTKRLGDVLLWLGRTKDGREQVFQGAGYSIRPVTGHALAHRIRSYAETSSVDDPIAWTYEMDGHASYVLTFPAANATWVYDVSAPEGLRWTERGTYNTTTATWDAWRPIHHLFGFGRHLVQDRSSGWVYELTTSSDVDCDGTVIERMRQAPHVHDQGGRVFFSRFALDVETGIQGDADTDDWGSVLDDIDPLTEVEDWNASGTAEDWNTLDVDPTKPTLDLWISDDNGQSWYAHGSRILLPPGTYTQQVFWDRCGASDRRAWRVRGRGDVRIVNAYLLATRGRTGR